MAEDHERLAAGVEEGPVHAPLGIGEDAEAAGLPASHRPRQGVAVEDAEQDEQPRPDLTDRRAVDEDARRGRALDERDHGAAALACIAAAKASRARARWLCGPFRRWSSRRRCGRPPPSSGTKRAS